MPIMPPPLQPISIGTVKRSCSSGIRREYSLANAAEMNKMPKLAGTPKLDCARSTTSAIAASKEERVDKAFAHFIRSAMGASTMTISPSQMQHPFQSLDRQEQRRSHLFQRCWRQNFNE